MFWLHLPTYLRTLCHGDSVLGYKISLRDKPLCLAVGVRNAFWDTKRRALVCQARIAKLNFGAVLEHAATSKAILQHSIESFGNRRQSSPASAATFCKYGRCRKVDQLQLQYNGQPRPVSGNSKTSKVTCSPQSLENGTSLLTRHAKTTSKDASTATSVFVPRIDGVQCWYSLSQLL